jgi:hypothetical protein
MSERIWHKADPNEEGVETFALDPISGTDYYRTVGFNGILKGDGVIYKKDNKEYTVVMVSRLGDFGLSETGELPYTLRVSPKDVYLI